MLMPTRLQPQSMHQHRPRQGIIGHDTHKVRNGRNERARGHGRIDMDLFEAHRDHGPYKTRNKHGKDQGKADAGRYAKGRKGIVGFYRIDIKTNAQNGNASQDQSIEETGAPFLSDEPPFIAWFQFLIHKDTDGYGKRLGPNVSRHIKDHGLKGHDKGQLCHDVFV